MAGIFKAYDIRGIVGDALTPELAYLIGRGLAARVFTSGGPIALTRDMRTHSPELYEQLSRGLRDGGLDVIDIGLAPTPMNYWAINNYNAKGGVQVTASHNGPKYNGFKVSGEGAVPFAYDPALKEVEEYCAEAQANGVPEAVATPGTSTTAEGALDKYLDWMQQFVATGPRALKIGIDTGNGMGGYFIPGVFERNPQFTVEPLFFELDGSFPNHEADPLKPENLVDVQNLVKQHGLDFGVAFDGDADRCMFVDEKGDSISSDLITGLIASLMLEKAPGSPILFDLRSSKAVPEWIEEHGGKPIRARVGHTFIKKLLRESGGKFGGELSGHYYFADLFNTDSGLMALIQILNLLSNDETPLSEHIAPLRRYSATGEINYRVTDAAATLAKLEKHYGEQGAKMDHLDGLTVELGDIKTGGWWFNLRSSNTEPLLRLNLEAKTPEACAAHLKEVQELLGVEPVQGH